MTYKFTINGTLPSLNEYIGECRRNPYTGARMKKKWQLEVQRAAFSELHGKMVLRPVIISYKWVEPTKRRDLDNVSGFGHKIIQDALVEMGFLEGDSWKYVRGYSDVFMHDKDAPRIEVMIMEVEEDGGTYRQL